MILHPLILHLFILDALQRISAMSVTEEDRRAEEGAGGGEALVLEEFEQFRNDDLESRLSGGGASPESLDSVGSISREEKLLEEMLRLKLTVGSASAMLPPKQRIKLYQPRSKLEQFEDILIESQLLEQALPDLAGSPLDYDRFEVEGLAMPPITDFDTSDAIFLEPAGEGDDRPEADRDGLGEADDGCRCDSCVERGALVEEVAEETRRLQSCWLQLRDDFKAVYRLVLEEAWGDSNRPRPELDAMAESVHKLVWRDPHQLYQRLESILRDVVVELRQRLVELLQKQAKNPNLAQEFIQSLLGGHDKLCEAAKLVGPVLGDLEVNHLRRFSLTWELLSKHLYQLTVYTDPLIQNNLPIFISQLRALYPNKENEDKYTELVRGYLDFDVEMENVGVFWSGTEALLLEYSQEQQRLREKQKMLKSDWERFKQQRKQIESSLMEKPQHAGGEEVEHVPGEEGEAGCGTGHPCECHVCTAPPTNGAQDCNLPLFPPSSPSHPPSSCSVYPHLYTSSSSSASSAVPSVSSLSAALSSALNLSTSQGAAADYMELFPNIFSSTSTSSVATSTSTCSSSATSATTVSSTPAPLPSTSTTSTSSAPPPILPIHERLPIPTTSTMCDSDGIRVTPAPEPAPPSRPKSLNLESSTSLPLPTSHPSLPPTTVEGKEEKKAAAAAKPAAGKPATVCNHKHNNANAKELKKLMGHDCGKPKPGARKSKSSSSVREEDGGESTEEVSEDSSPEDSCSSSASGDKHCACCYCEVFGHGGPSVAPVSRNYPEMRERLRLLLSKKKRSHRQAAGCSSSHPAAKPSPSSHPAAKPRPPPAAPAPPRTAPPPQAASRPQPAPPAGQGAAPQAKPVAAQPPPVARPPVRPQELRQPAGSISSPSPSPVMGSSPPQQEVKDILAKKDVDEVLEYIEGNKNLSNDKKRLKKERQKQQRVDELRVKQEEERRRKAAEESARKAREEEERMRKELEDKAAKKSKKKAAQKAKKLASNGGEEEEAPGGGQPENLLDLENLRLKHIREQKELLEEQKQQLIEQQRKLDEQLTMKIGERNAANAAVSAAEAAKASLSRKQAKRAAKASSPLTTSSSATSSPLTAPRGGVTITAHPAPAPGYTPPGYLPPPQAAPPPYYPGYSQQQQQGMYQQQHLGYQQFQGGFPGGPMGGSMGGPMGGPMGGSMGGPMGGPGGPMGGPMGGPGSFPSQGNPYQPQATRPPPPVVKSDQPMVTIKRVMRPDSSEPTVTISVKKDDQENTESKAAPQQQDKVLFTLVNGQVMKTANAPDNLIPGAKPMPQELAKRLMPEEGGDAKLSKKQKKRLGKGEGGGVAPLTLLPRAPALAPGGHVDLDKLRLPEGVSISKISGPVPERRYFPCKEGGPPPGAAPPPPAAPWTPSPSPYQHQQPNPYNQQQGFGPSPSYPSFGAAAPNSNVIVVDTNSLDDKDKDKLSKKAKKKAAKKAAEAAPPQPWTPQAVMQSQAQAPAKPKEWTPAQYGGYVPPAGGGSGGQVLIKSVNGKVVITPVPGTGAAPASSSSTPTPTTAKRASPPAPTPPRAAPTKRPLAPTAAPRAPATTRPPPAQQVNGSSNGGNNNIENQAPNEEMMNGNHAEDEKKNKKNKTKTKRNPDEKLEEINSIFAPREADTGDMDAADREIEQFKQFCLDSRPAQNRAKVSFDVRNIAFKKKA